MQLHNDQDILEYLRNSSTRELGMGLLVKKYQEEIYWLIRRMIHSHEDTDDLIQEVFIKVWKNIHHFREESQLFTWIYRIAVNETLSFLKKEKRRKFLSFSSMQEYFENTLRSDPFFDGDEIDLKLQKAVAQLPARQKLVFTLKYFEDMKYNDISRITGITEGALKASYHHAVKKIEHAITGTLNHIQ